MVLPKMARKYFEAGRKAIEGKRPPDELHGFRLETKRFRYTLELFRSCYGAGEFDARLEALKDVQTSLGDVNDAVATWQLLAKMMSHSPRRQALRKFLKERAANKADEFREHWTQQFDAPGRENWWTEFLGGQDGKDGTAVHGGPAGRRASRKATNR